jgi:hypothetical protein
VIEYLKLLPQMRKFLRSLHGWRARCDGAEFADIDQIAMNKHYGTPMVVTHGKPGVGQQYAGIVGGQSTDFTRIQSEAKTAKTENHPQFPPDL